MNTTIDVINAIKVNDIKSVKKYLFMGGDPNYCEDWASLTLLHIATLENSHEIVNILLHWHADTKIKDNIFLETAADLAEQAGNKELYMLLNKAK